MDDTIVPELELAVPRRESSSQFSPRAKALQLLPDSRVRGPSSRKNRLSTSSRENNYAEPINRQSTVTAWSRSSRAGSSNAADDEEDTLSYRTARQLYQEASTSSYGSVYVDASQGDSAFPHAFDISPMPGSSQAKRNSYQQHRRNISAPEPTSPTALGFSSASPLQPTTSNENRRASLVRQAPVRKRVYSEEDSPRISSPPLLPRRGSSMRSRTSSMKSNSPKQSPALPDAIPGSPPQSRRKSSFSLPPSPVPPRRTSLLISGDLLPERRSSRMTVEEEEIDESPPSSVGLTRTPEEFLKTASDEEEAKKASRRERVIQELVSTEWSYAQDLQVVRDVYLARARGGSLASIISSVSTSEWLHTSTPHAVHSPLQSSQGSSTLRPPLNHLSSSTSGLSLTSKSPFSPIRRASVNSPFANSDIKTIFLNIEELATFASAFSGLLDDASKPSCHDDRIGAAFLEMLPRIQSLYSYYCSRQGAALVKAEELQDTGRMDQYNAETSDLSKGLTQSWNLNALLIKPVQRCLKYPLLLQSILSCTPKRHPDYANLKQALDDMLNVAKEMNEAKKRSELVTRIMGNNPSKRRVSGPSPSDSTINLRSPKLESKRPMFASRKKSSSSLHSDDGKQRRPSAPALVKSTSSSFAQSLSKKLGRSGQRVKQAAGYTQDEPFDSALLEELCSTVYLHQQSLFALRHDINSWLDSIGKILNQQERVAEAWLEICQPLDDEAEVRGGTRDQVKLYRENVQLCYEIVYKSTVKGIQETLVPKIALLLDRFAEPQLVIKKRSVKLLDFQRSRRSSAGDSEDYLHLSHLLIEELPVFLAAISTAVDAIVKAFAEAQSVMYFRLHTIMKSYQEQHFPSPLPRGVDLVPTFLQRHTPLQELLDGLISISSNRVSALTKTAGLGISRPPSLQSVTSGFGTSVRRSQSAGRKSTETASDRTSFASRISSERTLPQLPTIDTLPFDRTPRINWPAPPSRDSAVSSTPNRDSAASSTPSFQFSQRASSSANSSNSPKMTEGTSEDSLPVLFQGVVISSDEQPAPPAGYGILPVKAGEELSVLVEDQDEQGQQWLLARKEGYPTVGYVLAKSVVGLR